MHLQYCKKSVEMFSKGHSRTNYSFCQCSETCHQTVTNKYQKTDLHFLREKFAFLTSMQNHGTRLFTDYSLYLYLCIYIIYKTHWRFKTTMIFLFRIICLDILKKYWSQNCHQLCWFTLFPLFLFVFQVDAIRHWLFFSRVSAVDWAPVTWNIY